MPLAHPRTLKITRADVAERVAHRIHAHMCSEGCPAGPGVADRNAAEAVLQLLHDADLLGPAEDPQLHLIDGEVLITWPEGVDRVLVHRPLMEGIVAQTNRLRTALNAVGTTSAPERLDG